MKRQRDNFKAGLFVIVGLALAVMILLTLADLESWLEKQQQVTVYYALSDGVRGLKPGAAVTLGDQPVGTVAAIEDVREEWRVIGKRITVSLPDRYKLCKNAAIELVEPPLGSGTRLNIRSVGSGTAYDPSTDIAGQLAGIALTESLVKDLGIQDLQRAQVRRIIGDIRRLTKALSDSESSDPVPVEVIIENIVATSTALPETAARVTELIDRVQPLTDEARQSMADLKQAAADVKAVAADLRGVVGDFRQRSGGWWDRVDNVTASADDAMGRVKTLIEDKDQTVRQTLDAVHEVSQRVRDDTMAQVRTALAKADEALENTRRATAELEAMVAGQRPVLERAIANAQITTGQLKLAAIEIRRSPWRLLYKPGDDELETDNLYDAARSFALAAGTLDSAAESLRAVAAGGTSGSQGQVDKMLDHLERLFGRFEEAETAFWEALRPTGARPPGRTSKPGS